MARGTNWIPDRNPSNLASPPQWFLDELWEFDNQLVIMPSREKLPLYRLVRRTRRTAGYKFISRLAKGLSFSPDTIMMAHHDVVPVASLPATVTWSARIFLELIARDTWRVGGGDKAADLLDAQDKAKEDQQNRNLNSELHERVNRSYEHFKARTGQRLSMVTPRAPTRTLPPDDPAAVS